MVILEGTWWRERQRSMRRAVSDDLADEDALFPTALLDLLDAVEASFRDRGGTALAWSDPHTGPGGEDLDIRDEEYSRCEHPERYRILWTRAEAWAEVLSDRGLAGRTTEQGIGTVRWRAPTMSDPVVTDVLTPYAAGAERLVIARTETAEGFPGVLLGIGDPTESIDLQPDCGCDACDSGSADLLETLDRPILSVVDGSLELRTTPSGYCLRSSFGAEAGEGAFPPEVARTVRSAPWGLEGSPLPMAPRIRW